MINMRLASSAFFLPVIFTFYNEDSLHCLSSTASRMKINLHSSNITWSLWLWGRENVAYLNSRLSGLSTSHILTLLMVLNWSKNSLWFLWPWCHEQFSAIKLVKTNSKKSDAPHCSSSLLPAHGPADISQHPRQDLRSVWEVRSSRVSCSDLWIIPLSYLVMRFCN